ncbi:hypothetical protein [Pseudomonas sp. IT-P294]|uniref:hypothetical protein n=1 Tax=Pseudomonas sp. IT-P294 TaxID=3026454 RepID=UPI0039E15AA4
MIGWASSIEVMSDICGAASGFILLAPTYRILIHRRVLYNLQKVMLAKFSNFGAPMDADLKAQLEAIKASVDEYNPKDTTLVMWGIWLVIISFVLKIIYHASTKFL